MERRTVLFSGRVQGVGFRYTAHRMAGGRAVVGYVQNLSDGRVQAVIEGEPAEVEAFLSDIRRHFEGDIAGVQIVVSVATGEFQAFEVRR